MVAYIMPEVLACGWSLDFPIAQYFLERFALVMHHVAGSRDYEASSKQCAVTCIGLIARKYHAERKSTDGAFGSFDQYYLGEIFDKLAQAAKIIEDGGAGGLEGDAA